MEETKTNPETPADAPQEQQRDTPRPAWQIWGARLAVVLFLILVAIQILSIARGGL